MDRPQSSVSVAARQLLETMTTLSQRSQPSACQSWLVHLGPPGSDLIFRIDAPVAGEFQVSCNVGLPTLLELVRRRNVDIDTIDPARWKFHLLRSLPTGRPNAVVRLD